MFDLLTISPVKEFILSMTKVTVPELAVGFILNPNSYLTLKLVVCELIHNGKIPTQKISVDR